MVMVIEGGIDAFRAEAYAETPRHVLDHLAYLGRNHDSLLTARARETMGRVRERVSTFSLQNVRRRAKSALRKAVSLGRRDCIRVLEDMGDMQHAPDVMLPWLMAHPRMNTAYRRKEIEGYGDRYHENFTFDRPIDNPYFRKAQNGRWVEQEDGCEVAVEYWGTDETEMLPDLLEEEVFDIYESWDKIISALDAMDDDPTSPYNAKL